MLASQVALDVAPIRAQDVAVVGRFLHEQLNSRVSAEDWSRWIVPPWQVAAPNHGFLLQHDGAVVGVYVAFYSERVVAGERRRFCNLGAWCVLDEHRAQGIRLLRALLRQPGYDFVDLSPSGSVVDLNTVLGFEFLDTDSVVVPNLPLPSRPGVRVLSRPTEVEAALEGTDLAIYRDHRSAAAALHFVVQVGGANCYVIARRDRRKGLPVFASLLHVSDPEVLTRAGHAPYRHLLMKHGALGTLVEHRVAGRAPRLSRRLPSTRRKMFRSRELGPASIDYLYSELVCVSW